MPAHAFPSAETPVPVVEYYNLRLHHYFLTASPGEMSAIEAGSAGPGWTRTGRAFLAYLPGSTLCAGGCGVPVDRFYTYSSNSHFYTADPAEAAGLEQPGSGWILERQEFSIPVPDAAGRCAAWQVPVYRLYNDRWMYNDSNHRYVTDGGERARMVAQGWIDEGVRFCAVGTAEVPISSYTVSARQPIRVMPSPQCEDESINRGPCIAINNLPTPSAILPTERGETPSAFTALTGQTWTARLFVVPPASVETSSRWAFVQETGDTLGVHVDSRGRGPSPYSSVNPLYQFHTTVDSGRLDDRFFPFGPHESDVQLAVHYTLNVKTIETRGEGSAAYGHPTLEFIDQRSGHHLYFTVLTYGTVAPADYLAPDVGTGKVIVGTTLRPDSPYVTSLGLPTLPTPSGFVSPNSWGWGGHFEFRMDRSQFQRVIDAARTVDATLSASPADYLVDNFHFNNEVYGDGEIGLNLADFTLELLRR